LIDNSTSLVSNVITKELEYWDGELEVLYRDGKRMIPRYTEWVDNIENVQLSLSSSSSSSSSSFSFSSSIPQFKGCIVGRRWIHINLDHILLLIIIFNTSRCSR
jgi:hypothetical protein